VVVVEAGEVVALSDQVVRALSLKVDLQNKCWILFSSVLEPIL
jgi:hypothetical protein